jgi:hypothetical protein
MKTGKILFNPDAPKDYGYGESTKIKVSPDGGGDTITLFVKTSHADVAKLAKGAIVEFDDKKLIRVVDGAGQSGAQSSRQSNNVTASQILLTWEAIYDAVEAKHPMLADELTIKVVTTIFIACMDKGAIAPAKEA